MIHSLFITHASFYGDKELKCNITIIVLKNRNIFDICINVDENIMSL